jgi:hypothetical protein
VPGVLLEAWAAEKRNKPWSKFERTMLKLLRQYTSRADPRGGPDAPTA